MFSWIEWFWDRITGKDRLKAGVAERAQAEAEIDEERIKRTRVLERNARQAAQNFRSVGLYEASRLEHEKASAYKQRRQRLQELKNGAGRSRLEVIKRDYGLG